MIIIIGDSWGVGEWGLDNNEYCLTGPGIGQYISMHNTVTNLSLGSGSNTQSLDRLEKFLTKYLIDAEDTVYWIVTDPLRCKDIKFLDHNVTIESTIKNLLTLCLARANGLAEKYSTTINLIGGLCDLDSIDLSTYKNLKICVPSWGKLIFPDYPSSLYCDSPEWKMLGKTLTTADKKQEFLLISELIELKRKTAKKIFTVDQSHPDRISHRVLRDYLYPEWKHKF